MSMLASPTQSYIISTGRVNLRSAAFQSGRYHYTTPGGFARWFS